MHLPSLRTQDSLVTSEATKQGGPFKTEREQEGPPTRQYPGRYWRHQLMEVQERGVVREGSSYSQRKVRMDVWLSLCGYTERAGVIEH